MTHKDPFDAILERLTLAGVPVEVLSHAPLFTMDDVDRTLAIPTARRVKSVVVATRGDDVIICGVRPDARLDLKAAAVVLGTSRSRLSLASPAVVRARLGLPPGAVGLVAPTPTVTLLDDGFRGLADVYFGAGRHDRTIRAPTDLLVEALGIQYAALAKHA